MQTGWRGNSFIHLTQLLNCQELREDRQEHTVFDTCCTWDAWSLERACPCFCPRTPPLNICNRHRGRKWEEARVSVQMWLQRRREAPPTSTRGQTECKKKSQRSEITRPAESNTVWAVAKGATIIPRSQTPASAPNDSQSCRPGGLEQTVTPLRRFTN